ncbi:conserved hypothetical protein [Anaeromyxobacter sp. K]|uniref:hypothetical protein n=1 Tax=Anaeromyxobacter sp. (strain K) TaxID=447217 RepID=UPI00015F9CEB|nr:hypothetical protein [Anaeromyxobacter sp. K]ACG74684.1 conserved hypothetical protein [Anaeromyxobacter sp. K]
MLKALAVLRTIFLLGLVVYVVAWAMPWSTYVADPIEVQYRHCSASLSRMSGAVWIAVAWIAFETVVGWMMSAWSGRRKGAARVPPPSSGEPPFAPPPRG